MEQRRYPRYQLVTPLLGVIEQDGGRFPGSVLNISVGGFYLHLPKLPSGNLKIQGVDDYGEIHYAGRNAYGFGSIVRVEKFTDSIGVGFSWDKDGMDAKSFQLLGEIIKEQEDRRAFGRVVVNGNTLALWGHASSALSHDVFAALRSIGAGQTQLSLAECTSIDSSGIELLMALRDRGVPIAAVNAEIEGILQRFQLSGNSGESHAG